MDDDGNNCCICLNDNVETWIKLCCNGLCKDCFENWTIKSNKCPFCNSPIEDPNLALKDTIEKLKLDLLTVENRFSKKYNH